MGGSGLRRGVSSRGAFAVDYLVTLAVLGLVFAAALVLVAAPSLRASYRDTIRAAASPIP